MAQWFLLEDRLDGHGRGLPYGALPAARTDQPPRWPLGVCRSRGRNGTIVNGALVGEAAGRSARRAIGGSDRSLRLPAKSGTPGRAARTRQGGPPPEQALRELLAQHQGNIAAVGRALGKERGQVHLWLRRYGIDVSEYRPPDD